MKEYPMNNSVKIRVGNLWVPFPKLIWNWMIAREDRRFEKEFELTEDIHRVRNFAVAEMGRTAQPISPDQVAAHTGLAVDRVIAIIDELDAMISVFQKDANNNVICAYPFAVDNTPHHVQFESGERINATWAMDALTTPFVQGKLTNQKLSATIESTCTHCGEILSVRVNENFECLDVTPGAEPVICLPIVSEKRQTGSSYFADFWQPILFYCSGEHAQHYKAPTGMFLVGLDLALVAMSKLEPPRFRFR